MKHNNFHIMGITEEVIKQGIDNLGEEIMAKKFPNLMKEKDTQVQEVQRVQTRWAQRSPQQDT